MRRRVRGRDAEAGTTLAELLVTMTVLSLLGVLLVGLTVTVSGAFTRDRSLTDSTREASVVMREVTRVIRSAATVKVAGQATDDPAFLVAGPHALVVRTYVDTDSDAPSPVVVRFDVTDAGQLTESRWPAVAGSAPYWTFAGLPAAPFQLAPDTWTGAAWTRTLGRGLTPPATGSVSTFRYHDADGDELVPGSAGLAANQLAGVASVTVTVSVQADATGRARPVVLRNSVGLPNLGLSRRATS
ncbi:hypothetical protein [uncultured Cellulomonas sp.]|uniref:hypothetical protein n=1 Tax=uncultured Cellulomonas sp. TaxID=189682 RepID=UPI00262B6304|nr:hypothetical protein [uncultured Cellulomonas sp.]